MQTHAECIRSSTPPPRMRFSRNQVPLQSLNSITCAVSISQCRCPNYSHEQNVRWGLLECECMHTYTCRISRVPGVESQRTEEDRALRRKWDDATTISQLVSFAKLLGGSSSINRCLARIGNAIQIRTMRRQKYVNIPISLRQRSLKR